ncbi:hypothetical protein MKW92_028549 [Papaver armeniacum]|nr:hypothetical protein MKW92_028549 [Papaver armeniacum]
MFWRRYSHKEIGFDEKPCLKRHFEARDWHIVNAKKMVEETIQWRLTFKPNVAIEGETGKLYQANFHDRHGRTVLMMRPGKWYISFRMASITFPIIRSRWHGYGRLPTIRTPKETLNIIQNHYPERIAVAFCTIPQRFLKHFGWLDHYIFTNLFRNLSFPYLPFEIVKHFLDPKTFDKVKFVYLQNKDSVELMKTYFDDKNLPTEFEFSKLMVKDELKATREREIEKMEHTNNGSLKPEVAQESVIAPTSS